MLYLDVQNMYKTLIKYVALVLHNDGVSQFIASCIRLLKFSTCRAVGDGVAGPATF